MSQILLTPGPVPLHPEVIRILAQPMIHHRTPAFDEILSSCLQKLPKIFGTREKVFMHSSTGSGGMESVLVNVLSPGDKVLAIVSGKFGERWAEMAKTFGMQVDILNVNWGEAVTEEQVQNRLLTHTYRAVLCQACETSTAVLHPIRELGELIAKLPETLFLVDGITAVGAADLPMDLFHIDGLVAGSQKALMLPTGLSFVSFSQKAQKYFATATCPRFYFDIRKEQKANTGGETFYSSNVLLVRALDWVLNFIEQQGLKTFLNTVQRRSVMTHHFLSLAGLRSYSKNPSPSLTAIVLPENSPGVEMRKHLEDKYSVVVMGGQDQLKGKILRIGHMGYIQDSDMQSFFEALMKTFLDFKIAGWTEDKMKTIVEQMRNWCQKNS